MLAVCREQSLAKAAPDTFRRGRLDDNGRDDRLKPITHLRKLEDAGYLTSEKTGDGAGSTTTVALTTRGRAVLDAYTEALRNLLGGLAS